MAGPFLGLLPMHPSWAGGRARDLPGGIRVAGTTGLSTAPHFVAKEAAGAGRRGQTCDSLERILCDPWANQPLCQTAISLPREQERWELGKVLRHTRTSQINASWVEIQQHCGFFIVKTWDVKCTI